MTRRSVRTTRSIGAGAASTEMTAQTVPSPTVATTTAAESTNPSLPHDRDETVGMTGGVPSARVPQGARDLARGIRDTTRGPEADAAYRKLKK